MKKVLLLILSLFVSPAFASGINANSASAPCTNNTLETYSGNTNLAADWQPNEIQLRWYNENERLTVQQSAQSCVYDGTLTIPSTQPTRTGYTFAGWEVKYTIPAGYTELEYIETNHNAYIMTDLTVNDFDRVTARIKLLDNNTESSTAHPHLFGVSANSSNGNVDAKLFRFYDGNNHSMNVAYYNVWASSGWSNLITGKSFPLNSFTDVDVKLASGEQYVKVNGETKASNNLSATFTNPYTLPLFAMSYAGSVRFIPHIDCERITFYLNNNIVRNFIPAKRNSDNVVGMYDSITNRFFTNAGTGTFIAGPA